MTVRKEWFDRLTESIDYLEKQRDRLDIIISVLNSERSKIVQESLEICLIQWRM